MAARGKLVDRNWKRTVTVENDSDQIEAEPNGERGPQTQQVPATIDDISVFVIPILAYKEEYLSWKANKFAGQSGSNQDHTANSENVKSGTSDMNKTPTVATSPAVDNKNQQLANGEHAKSEAQLSDTSDSDLEEDMREYLAKRELVSQFPLGGDADVTERKTFSESAVSDHPKESVTSSGELR